MGNQCTSLSSGVILAALLFGVSVEEKIELIAVSHCVSDE